MAKLLASLRAVVPLRPLTVAEGFGLAEIQAQLLLASAELVTPPVPDTVVTDFPRVRVTRQAQLPISGASHWSAGMWAIVVNADEPHVRQRFTMAHELKHVLDAAHGPEALYPAIGGLTSVQRAEHVCDFFAACLLMPRPWVKRAYCADHLQDAHELARRFVVSRPAMRRRLRALGFDERRPRCQTSAGRRHPYRGVPGTRKEGP